VVALACQRCPARRALFQAWERRLEAEGLGIVPLTERYWDPVAQTTHKVLSIETNLAHLNHPDTDRLLPTVDPFEDAASDFQALMAAIPPEIAAILELDHRRRTRQEKERLAAWLKGEGRHLVRYFGFM